MKFEIVPIDSIKPMPALRGSESFIYENPNIMDPESFRMLVNNIRRFGIDAVDPIRVLKYDSTYYIIDGNHRYLACKDAGLNEVPVVVLDISIDDAYLMMVRHNIIKGNYDVVRFARMVKALHKKFGLSILRMLDDMNLTLEKFKKLRRIADVDDEILDMLEGRGASIRLLTKIADILSEARSDPVIYRMAKSELISVLQDFIATGTINYLALEAISKKVEAKQRGHPPQIDITRIDYQPPRKGIKTLDLNDVEESPIIGMEETAEVGFEPSTEAEAEVEVEVEPEVEGGEVESKSITYEVRCLVCDEVIAKVTHKYHSGEVSHEVVPID